MLEIVILAAGKGTRMKSALPKVLHTIAGKPMLAHVLEKARQIKADNIHLVIGHGRELIEQNYAGADVNFCYQEQQLGTGHAVQQALPNLDDNSTVLILYGDVPLTSVQTLTSLLDSVDEKSLSLLTVDLKDPTGYGRIIRDSDGNVLEIIEQKDASQEQLTITEGNTGVMALNSNDLKRWLPALSSDNAQGEFYLTDIIAMARKESFTINTAAASSEYEVLGVNDRSQQAQLERYYQQQKAAQLMAEGVTLLDPARFDCRGNIEVGRDVVIDVNCIFEGDVYLGDNVQIGPNCTVINSRIDSNSVIKANTMLESATIGEACELGPFARARPGTNLSKGAKLGNFVETKKANIGEGSKVNHLSYIGDADIGTQVNVGAGTITCNYDGVNKSKTTIGDGAFIGSNSSLVAPVTVGIDATVGAGSTITGEVPDRQLSVARAKQRNIGSWKRPEKK